ncbi:MAG TPA: glycosyltransferase family 1 protein [Candidatus Saccharimonadales bacterium]|nr:glycosyltransferase family 1 protein [Candidatus Saccharimonadales bacterium]
MTKHIVIDARIRRATTGRYIDRLVEHLQDLDHQNTYTILVAADDPFSPRAGNFRALPCPYPQFSVSPLPELQFAWQLYRLKPDLVHFGMTQQPLLYFGNIVTTTHDLTMFQFVRRGTTPPLLYWLKMGLYRFLVRWSHMKSKRIIVPTNTTAAEVAQFQPSAKKKLVVTYESSESALAMQGEKHAGVDGDFLLYVGTAFPHKNLQTLVKAFGILHKQRPHLQLVITGKREEKHHAELIAWCKTLSYGDHVIFPGFVSDPGLKWLYEHCSAYVFTSLSEGFGLPPLEAMAHGAPVVSSDASVMPEVYGEGAHYFDAHDPKDVAAKVAEVLDDKTLRGRLIERGHTQLTKYSWKKMAKETLAIYMSLLK